MPPAQTWDPDLYDRHARFVSDLGMPVVELLAPQPGERVLDLGCGDGVLTEKLVSLGCQVVGVDSSAPQIEAALARGLDARVMDAEQLTFDGEFDAVFSNAAMHWMPRPDDVIAGVRRALKPAGRFVGEFGGHGCVATIKGALSSALSRRGLNPDDYNPWYFPTDDEYRRRLQSHSFHVSYIALIPRPTPLPGDITAWLETFAQSFLTPIPPRDRPSFLAEVRALVRPHLCDPAGGWSADYIRLRFAAQKLHA